MSSDKESKTEDATPKKLHDARQEGQIAKSQDLVAWSALFLSLTLIERTATSGGRFLVGMMHDMGNLIDDPDQGKAMQFMIDAMAGTGKLLAPLALGFAALCLVGHLAQVRFIFTTKAMKPKFSKLNPITGAKNLLGPQSLMQAAKQVFKTAVIGYIGYKTLWATMTGLADNGPYALGEIIRITGIAVMSFLKQAAIAGVVISIFDYGYQRHKTAKNLRMTKQEVKDESKNSEGNPEIKGKIRQKQRAMSRNRMMSAIKEADVVIVNPVHIAIALKYDPNVGAPKVLAKGAGFVAEKIRERADEHKVPLVQDIPLARTLHRMCDVDDEIPADLFEAVARLLAFVFALRAKGSADGYHRMPGSPDMAEADAMEARAKAAEAKSAAEQRFGAGAATGSSVGA